jgi:hypothetical protein
VRADSYELVVDDTRAAHAAQLLAAPGATGHS